MVCFTGFTTGAFAADAIVRVSMTDEQLNNELDLRYQAWVNWVGQNSHSSTVTDCREFKDIVSLGPKALPQIIENFRSGKWSPLLSTAVGVISQVRIPPERWPKDRVGDAYSAVGVYLRWWDVDRALTKTEFDKLYAKWNELKKSEDSAKVNTGQLVLWYDAVVLDNRSGMMIYHRQPVTPLGEIYISIQDLGIDILPIIVKQLEAGNTDFLAIFHKLTNSQAEKKDGMPKERLDYVLKWWNENKGDWLLPEPAAQHITR